MRARNFMSLVTAHYAARWRDGTGKCLTCRELGQKRSLKKPKVTRVKRRPHRGQSCHILQRGQINMSEMLEATPYAYSDIRRHDILRIIPSDGRVIGSIGCGTAWAEAELVKQGREVHGVDIAPEAISVAKQRLTSARIVSPTEAEPFAPCSLDGLILADVLEHIPLAWKVLQSFAKSVRPGGWIIISVPNMRSPHLLQFIIRGDWPEKPLGIFDATHVQIMSKKRLERWCGQANLQIERWYDHYGPQKYRFRAADRMTFRVFHSWFTYQLQCVCRVKH